MGISELRKIEAAEPKNTEKPRALPLRDLFVDPETFQWRVSKYNMIESAEHIRALVRVLKNTRQPFEPLLVFPIGKRFVVIDGHHRLTAYRKARWKQPIPVNVFEGTLDEARFAALEGNVRDKLRMSGPEKREAAWKLVKENILSKAQIVKLGVAADGTIATMRKVRKKLMDDGIDPIPLSWVAARWNGIEFDEIDPEDWKAKKAKKIVDALFKAKIGQGLCKDAEVTAIVLQMLNPGLPGALVRLWWFDDPELKSELAEELRLEDNPYEAFRDPEEPEQTVVDL